MSLKHPYQRRPDPDEPWRYECPKCGSVDIRKNANNGKPARPTTHDYHCNGCHQEISPVDLKGEA